MANGDDPKQSGVSSESTTSPPNWQTSMMNVNSDAYKSTLNKSTPVPVNTKLSSVGNVSSVSAPPVKGIDNLKKNVDQWRSDEAKEKTRYNALTDDQKKAEHEKKLAEQQQADHDMYLKKFNAGYGGITTGAANIAATEGGQDILNWFPGSGEIIDAKNTVKDFKNEDYTGGLMSAAGLMLPFIPGGAVKRFFRGSKKATATPIRTPKLSPTKIDTRPYQNKVRPAYLDDATQSPDFDVVDKLITETNHPNTKRRLRGLGVEHPEDFTMHAANKIRYVDRLKEGGYYSPRRQEVNFGSKMHKDHFKHWGDNKDYFTGSHELHGHGVQDYIRNTNPDMAPDGRTWVDNDFQSWLKNNASDSDFIKKHGYSENPTTDYFLNSRTPSQGVTSSKRLTPHGTEIGWSSEPLAHLSEMRREMGTALNRPVTDVFGVDDIMRFSNTPLGKKNRILNTGVPQDYTLASFLDKAPVSAGVIGTVGGYGLLRGQRTEQKEN